MGGGRWEVAGGNWEVGSGRCRWEAEGWRMEVGGVWSWRLDLDLGWILDLGLALDLDLALELDLDLELLAAPGCFWLQASRPPDLQATRPSQSIYFFSHVSS